MVSIEQVQLLEAKIAKAIDYVQRVNAENAFLSSERANLQTKLESYQKRIDELEVLIMRFKEDQGRIEDGIIAALDRLSQFEEAFEKSLTDDKAGKKPAAKREKAQEVEIPRTTSPIYSAALSSEISRAQRPSAASGETSRAPVSKHGSKEFFEIAEAEDSNDPLISNDGELDIF